MADLPPKTIATEAELIEHVLALPEPDEARRLAALEEIMFPRTMHWMIRVGDAAPDDTAD